MGLASIPSRIRSLQRLPQILTVLFKYGFGDVVSRVGIDTAVHQLKSAIFHDVDPRFVALRTEERIRRALEELGPTFVKLGQVMATRPDLIPMSLVTELRKLQDKVTPFESEAVRRTIEEELGKPAGELFAELDAEPLAAASIGQVHRATLRDGRKVILKVQRPNLERIIETDLDILTFLAELAEERVPELRRYNPVGLVSEFRHSISKEIDFETEAYHTRRFAANFKDDPDVYVPAVHDELTTSRVLCEEFIEGTPLNHPKLLELGLDLPKVARTGIRVALEQALVHGFFHADPHPGNIFVLPGSRLCLIDYGMMGTLDQERIDELLTFLVAILTRDLDKLIRLFHRLELIGEEVDVRGLRREVDDLICRFQSVELARIDIGKFLNQVFDVITKHEVQLPSDLLLVAKALATIEGVGRQIYPELNTVEEIRPIILKIYLGRMTDPGYHSRAPRRATFELISLLETGPRDLRLALRKARRGELQARLHLENLDQASRSQAQATNRLALSILTGSLVLAAAYLFTRTDLTPWIGDFPLNALLGVLGLGLATLYGGVLLVGFLRSGAF